MTGYLWQKVAFDGWMLDVWAASHMQAINLTSTHPGITGRAHTKGVNLYFLFLAYNSFFYMWNETKTYIVIAND